MVVGLKVNLTSRRMGWKQRKYVHAGTQALMDIQATRALENPLFSLRHRHSPEWGQFDLELTEPQFIVHQQRHAASFD